MSQPTGHNPSRKRKTSFAGDVLKLVSGTSIAQILGILASPIIARLFAPEAFGVHALFVSIATIISTIACLRYEVAIMLPEGDDEAANMLGASLFFAVLISLLTVPLLWWGRAPLLDLLNAPELGPYLWLIPPTVLVSGFFLALNFWNSRTKQFGRLSVAKVADALTTTGGKLAAGFAGFATGGAMIGATAAGKTLATTALGVQIWRDDAALFRSTIRWPLMRALMIRYKKFPLINSWSTIFNILSSRAPEFILAAYFSTTVVGLFALGQRILALPATFIGQAISGVFLQRISVARLDGTMPGLVEKTLRGLILISIFPFTVLLITVPELFAFVFGQQWYTAGVYAQVLMPWFFFSFVMSPLSVLIPVMEKQEIGLFYNIFLFATRIISLLIGAMRNDPLLALGLFSSSGAFLLLLLCIYAARLAGMDRVRILHAFLNGIIGLLFAAPLALLKYFMQPSVLILIAAAALLALLYFAFILVYSPDIRDMLAHGIAARRKRKSAPLTTDEQEPPA